MKYSLFPFFIKTAMFREAANEGGGGSFFKAGSDADTTTEGGETTSGGTPDWVLPKYHVTGEDGTFDLAKSIEGQARAASELYGKLSTKTETMREEVLSQVKENYAKEIGVPDDPADYAYPENVKPPEGDLDEGLRAWAKENNVSADAFSSLIEDVYAKTLTDSAAELEKLGDHAEKRLDAVNKWLNANVESDHFGAVERLMTTADGVAFVESMMKKAGNAGFAPDGSNDSGQQLTREGIRQMQADPKFGADPAYTASVREMWTKFAAQNGR